jgi:hypothetical protein
MLFSFGPPSYSGFTSPNRQKAFWIPGPSDEKQKAANSSELAAFKPQITNH